MNERDFDKILSDKLNEGKDFPRKKENWQKVAAKLDGDTDAAPIPIAIEKNKGFKRGLWALLLLALLGSIAYQNAQIGNLKTEMNALKTTTILHDTIIQTQIIHSKDTVVKIIYLKEPNGKSALAEKLPPSVSNLIFSKRGDLNSEISIKNNAIKTSEQSTLDKNIVKNINNSSTSIPNNEQILMPKNLEKPDAFDEKSPKITVLKDSIKTLNNLNDSLKMLLNTVASQSPTDSNFNKPNALKSDTLSQKLSDSNKPILDSLAATLDKPSTIIKPKKGFKIQDFRVGVNAGYNWLLPNVEGVKPSLWLGVTGEAAFNQRWRASLSADFSDYHLQLKENEGILNLPETPIIEPRFRLDKIESEYVGLAGNIGLHYVLMPQKRIRPIISIGYTLRYINEYHTEFEFKDSQTGEELQIEISSPSHIDNWWLLGGGIEMNVSKRLEARFKMDYHLDFNHGNDRLQYLLLRGGVYYKF